MEDERIFTNENERSWPHSVRQCGQLLSFDSALRENFASPFLSGITQSFMVG